MKKQISSLAELRLEIENLSVKKHMKERELNKQFKDWSQTMKPANLIKSAFSSLTGDSELKTQLASKGTEAALGFIVTNLLFKNSNPIVRTAATIVGTAFASKVFGEDSAVYIDKIKTLFEKFKKKEDDIVFDEKDNYAS